MCGTTMPLEFMEEDIQTAVEGPSSALPPDPQVLNLASSHLAPSGVDPALYTLEGTGDTHQVQIFFGDSLYFSNFALKLLGEKR